MTWLAWIVGAFILTGFLVACYACCACPSGQLDGAFEDDISPEDVQRMERELAKLELDEQ